MDNTPVFNEATNECQGKRHRHGRKRSPKSKEEKHNGEKKEKCHKERRCAVLARIFGEAPEKYAQFEQDNQELKMGKLIAKYKEVNQITFEKLKKEKGEGRSEKNEQRRIKILAKVFGGKPEEYNEFQAQNKELRMGRLIQKYMEQNELKAEKVEFIQDRTEKRNKRKLEKLARFFNQPEENFTDLVKENPDLCFKKLLKVKGVETESEAFREFKRKEQQSRKERREARKNKEEGSTKKERKPREKKSHSKERKPKREKRSRSGKKQEKPLSKEKVEMKEDARNKGKIFLQMKDLFGNQNAKEYFKFIEANYELGQEAIIQKWIETHQ